MADPDSTRPPSAAAARRPVSVTHSRQPSVASRGSRSSLRRQELQPSSASPTHTPPQDILPAPTPPAAEPQLQDLPPPRQEQQRQPPPPSQAPFTPLFTLVSSTSQPGKKPTLHHPTVHYIFADDDPEILTEALARHHRTAEDPDDDDDDGDQQLLSQDNDPTSRRPRDRAILLDLVPKVAASRAIARARALWRWPGRRA
ncbi:hypothetical protein VTK73DRAFT_1185 [Phialemonium thermophilum]|uniref:Uncharacterized protein n=1 Tax=Phialemonium thermophilum TaxID=223376 RepID=A0ABR3VTR4_9PEZI